MVRTEVPRIKTQKKAAFKPGIKEENQIKKLRNRFGNSERVLEAYFSRSQGQKYIFMIIF